MNKLEKIDINGNEQWVLVRGKNMNDPLILQVQAGPGLPMIAEANTMGRLLHLEDEYLVAYWDQRGCGKSFNKYTDPKTITLSQMADDVTACAQYLAKKYNKEKVILIGHSIGATVSLMAAAKDSSLFSQLFLVGIDIDIPRANAFALEFARAKAREQNSNRLLKKIDLLSEAPIVEAKRFQQRARIIADLGGIKHGSSYNQILIATIKNMLFTKAYGLPDILRTIKGMEFCQNALLPEMNDLDLFKKVKKVDVPVHFLQGKLDAIAPYETAISYYNYLKADIKTFTAFDHSAHTIPYEEPEKFIQVLKEQINQ